jgi:phosphate-selective porin OprO/OprP
MSKARFEIATAFSLIGTLLASQAHAQSAGNNDAEIAALRQQLRLMEQKLDKLQRQTAANTAAAAKANAKAEAGVSVANANAAHPAKGLAPPDAVAKMPNNRPTICTADGLNCVAITSRVHLDAGGHDYRPNTAATVPQRLNNGVNTRRARIGVTGKFLGDWNYALVYDFGGSSDGFGSTASAGGTTVGFLPGGALSGIESAYLSYTGLKPFRHSCDRRRRHGCLHWTRQRARTTSCSWNAPPPASSPPASPPAPSAPPSARAGTMTGSGPGPT